MIATPLRLRAASLLAPSPLLSRLTSSLPFLPSPLPARSPFHLHAVFPSLAASPAHSAAKSEAALKLSASAWPSGPARGEARMEGAAGRDEKRIRMGGTVDANGVETAKEAQGTEAAAGEGGKRIGTHNGTFHCDEALGCFMLRRTSKFKDAEIVRTRDEQVLGGLDAVLDVGGVYDPSKDRYDHHQKGFQADFGHGFTTKLSSAGLVYKHYGRELIAHSMGLTEDHPDVGTVFVAVYKNFIEAVDAIDNGVDQFDSGAPPKYQNNTHLAARVARLNPDWMDDSSEAAQNAAFLKAVVLTGTEFLESVSSTSRSWLPARSIVAASLADAPSVHPSGQIVVLQRFCPWKLHLAELEVELGLSPEQLPKYVIYEDDRSGQWRVQAVAVAPGSFQSRLPLPQAWRGLRDAELSAACGIPGCVFVHMSGFIGGNATKEGTGKMAEAGLTHASCN